MKLGIQRIRTCRPNPAGAALGGALLLGAVWAAATAARMPLDALEGRPPIVVWQVPAQSDHSPDRAWGDPLRIGHVPLGSRIVLLNASGSTTALTQRFSAVGLPDLSHDASRLLFVGRTSPNDPWAVWEVSLGDGAARLIVPCPSACDRAVYLSTLYTLDAERPVAQLAFRALDEAYGVPAIFRCGLDGSDVQQITFSPDGAADPLLLTDGRLLFSMASQSSPPAARSDVKPARHASTFFTVNTDGTDLFPFTGQGAAPAARSDPTEMPDGRVVFVERSLPPGGRLAAVQRTHSVTVPTELLNSEEDLRRPLFLAGNEILAARRTGASPQASYQVAQFEGEARTWLNVLDDPQFHDFPAALVMPRRLPPGRSTVVNPDIEFGQLYCLNSYIQGGEAPAIGAGDIHRIRVYSLIAGQTDAVPGVLGELEVEPDGSFFAELPARTPISLETLDAEGQSIQRMRSWFWVMPMERRGCIGCHEDRELTPPNRHVFALRKRAQRIGLPYQFKMHDE